MSCSFAGEGNGGMRQPSDPVYGVIMGVWSPIQLIVLNHHLTQSGSCVGILNTATGETVEHSLRDRGLKYERMAVKADKQPALLQAANAFWSGG
jgi:hypothetical protein